MAEASGRGHARLVMLGAEGAGKTTLARRAREACSGGGGLPQQGRGKTASKACCRGGGGGGGGGPPQQGRGNLTRESEPVPTIGVELHTLGGGVAAAARGGAVELREVGGSMRSVWPTYLAGADALVYVLDAANPAGAAAGATALWRVLTEEAAQQLPVLLVLNKQDLPCVMPRAQLEAMLRLDDLRAALGARLTTLDSASATAAVGAPGAHKAASQCAAEMLKWAADVCNGSSGPAKRGKGTSKVSPL